MAKIVDKEEKKIQILQAALKVIGEKGIAGTKIQDIAEAAGMGKGTVYLYYKNKDEILKSILSHHIGTGAHSLSSVAQSGHSAEDKIRHLLNGFAASIEHHPYPPGTHLEILAALTRDGKSGEQAQGILEFRDQMAGLLREFSGSNGKDDLEEHLSSALIAMLHGLVILWSADKNSFDIEKIVGCTTDTLLKAIKG